MFDLIIIGAGPGGYELAIDASNHGLQVLLVEKAALGGTCLNSGCIPTKAYYHQAHLLKSIIDANEQGIMSEVRFDFTKAYERKNKIVQELKSGIEFLLKKAKVTVIYGEARFLSSNTIQVNDEEYIGKNIVIATGSTAFVPKLAGLDLEGVITSTELLDLQELPSDLCILGAGVIGIEIAAIFNRFGVKVTVIEMLDRILPTLDKEVSKRLLAYLKAQGISFKLNSKLESVVKTNDGLLINYLEKEKEGSVETSKLLVSVGRKPNIENLGLENLKLDYSNKGIHVDEFFQTNIPNIFAIGDVTGKMMLAHAASYAGKAVLKKILKEESKIDFNIIPACVFSLPEVATVGLTEEECLEMNYQVSKHYFKANGKALTISETDGFIKIISIDEIIKGVHIMGPHAGDLIHEAVIHLNLYQ